MRIRQRIEEALQKIVPSEVPFAVARSTRAEFGEYASSAAFAVAKITGKDARKVAESLVEKLRDAHIEGVERIDVASGGFLNFFLDRAALAKQVKEALQKENQYGTGQLHTGKRIVVEYTDPNPFKNIHMGHLMSNAIGEAIARLYTFGGASVVRANYQGDVGLHVAKAVWAMQGTAFPELASLKEQVAYLNRMYVQGNQTYESGDSSNRAHIDRINTEIYEKNNKEINKLYQWGRKASLDYFETLYRRVGTKFDEYFFESETGARGKRMVLEHVADGVFAPSDGAIVFRGEQYGLHTRVFVNSEGFPTYEAKELGLAAMKAERVPADQYVVVTGNEIVDYFRVVQEATKRIMPDIAAKTFHVPHGMLRAKDGKISSRTGTAIAADEFLDEVRSLARKKMQESGVVAEDKQDAVADDVAVAAVKYVILKHALGRDVVFEPETALSFVGDSGPYLQYTAARARSVMEKAAQNGIAPDAADALAADESTRELQRGVFWFPEVVTQAAFSLAPHHVATYLTELAQAFNRFYAAERIADAGTYAPVRLAVTRAVLVTLRNGLWLLGIASPQKM